MYHVIEFVADWWADLEREPGQPVERTPLFRGSRRRVETRPRVFEGERGPVEAADLLFEDGSIARSVPFAFLTFVDRPVERPTK